MKEYEVSERLEEALTDLPGGRAVAPVGLGWKASRRLARRRRWQVAGAALVAVAISVSVSLLVEGGKRSAVPAAGTAESFVHGTWTTLPNAPIEVRYEPAAVWTGSLFVLWGGQRDGLGTRLGDGAAYDPETRTWTTLPTGPLIPRVQPATAWTGTEMLVWGGSSNSQTPSSDGALYDPSSRTWRPMATSPLAARFSATVTSVGSKVTILGGHGANTKVFFDGATYDADTDSWAMLPALPRPANHDYSELKSAHVGATLVVQASWFHINGVVNGQVDSDRGVDTYMLDGAAWRALPADAHVGRGEGALLTVGDEAVQVAGTERYFGQAPQPPSGLIGHRLDVTTGVWSDMAHGPVDDFGGSSLSTGSAVLTYGTSTANGNQMPGEAAAWDPEQDRWYSLPRAPYYRSDRAVWTGKQLLLWGNLYGNDEHGERPSGTQLIAFTPSHSAAPKPSETTAPPLDDAARRTTLEWTSKDAYLSGKTAVEACATDGTTFNGELDSDPPKPSYLSPDVEEKRRFETCALAVPGTRLYRAG